MTINIIRSELIKYTQSQCLIWDIPTQSVQSGFCWHQDRQQWLNGYADLPVYKDTRIILIPKNIVRYRMLIDHSKYYNNFMLNYLQAEHLRANSSLVETLKNKKQVVRKKKLKEVYPLKKDKIAKFAEDHPETVEKYKELVRAADIIPHSEWHRN